MSEPLLLELARSTLRLRLLGDRLLVRDPSQFPSFRSRLLDPCRSPDRSPDRSRRCDRLARLDSVERCFPIVVVARTITRNNSQFDLFKSLSQRITRVCIPLLICSKEYFNSPHNDFYYNANIRKMDINSRYKRFLMKIKSTRLRLGRSINMASDRQ